MQAFYFFYFFQVIKNRCNEFENQFIAATIFFLKRSWLTETIMRGYIIQHKLQWPTEHFCQTFLQIPLRRMCREHFFC